MLLFLLVAGEDVVLIRTHVHSKKNEESKFLEIELAPYCGGEMPLEVFSVKCTFRCAFRFQVQRFLFMGRSRCVLLLADFLI